jgi:hypothetical protein
VSAAAGAEASTAGVAGACADADSGQAAITRAARMLDANDLPKNMMLPILRK